MQTSKGLAYIGGDEEVVVGELKAITTSQDRWLARRDVVSNSHLRHWLSGSLRMSSGIFPLRFYGGMEMIMRVERGRSGI